MKVNVCFICLFFTFINAAISQKLYTTNLGSNNSTVIDTKTNAVINTIALANNPFGVVTNPVLNKVYFSNYNSGSVSVLNPCSNNIEFIITGLGTNPSGMSVSPDGQRLYVSIHGENKIKVINTATNTVIATIIVGNLPVSAPHLSVVSHDNSKVYVTLFDEDKVAVINAVTNTVIGYYATDSRPSGIDLSTDNSKLYVTNYYPPQLSVYNTTTGIRTNVVSLGSPVPNGVESAVDVVLNHANTKAYISIVNTSSVAVVNTVTNTVTNTIPTGQRGLGIDIHPDDSKVYLSCANSNRIDVINTTTNIVANSIAVGSNPYCIGRLLLHTNIDSVKITPTQISCLSYNFSGQAFVNSIPITGWQWYFGDGGQATTQNTSHTYAGTGTYTVKLVVTDANGCKDSTTTNVTTSQVTVNTTNDTSICRGLSVQLNTTGATTYSWSPTTGLSNPNIPNPVATPNVTTKYYVTGTVPGGCSGVDSLTITVLALPNVVSSPDSNICAGMSIQLNSSGALSYSWSPATGLSNSSIPNPVATPSVPTQYIVTGTAANGCTGKDTVNINLTPLPVVDATPDNNLCFGSSIQLNATGAVTYSWSPATGLSNSAIPNPVALPIITTKYYVTGTAASGCNGIDSVTITLIPVPTVVTTIDSEICTGTSIQLNTTGAASYSWSPATGLSNSSIANPIATPLANTQYIVTGTAANGCTAKDTVNISLKPLPIITATIDSTICPGRSVQLNSSGATSYSWSPATGLNNPSISNPIATPLVNTQYIVSGTGANGCTGKDTVNISLHPATVVDATPDNNLCTGSSLQLNATGAATYSWSPAIGLSSTNISNPVASPAISTKYYVTGTSANGCTGIDSVTITLLAIPVVVASIDSNICTGSSIQLNTAGAATYSWSPVAGLSNPSIANPIATPLVPTQYIVTGTAANTCTAKDTVNIGLKPSPVITKSNDTTICTAGSAQLNVAGGLTYSWTPVTGLNNPSIPNPVASPTTTTNYKVTVTGANSCSKLDSIKVTTAPSPVYTISSPSPICNNSSIQLLATGGDLYSWLPVTGLSNPSIANPNASPNITTPYAVRIISSVCHDTVFRATVVTVNQLPTISAVKSNDINCSFPTAQLLATGGVNYAWSPSTGLSNAAIANPIATITTTTTYTVTGTDMNNCTGTATVTVQAGFVPGGNLYIPNAFTPNGDGKNDCFGVRVYGTVNSFELSVFNRYGEKVFYTTDPSKCWDGIYKTRKQQIGNYVYMVKAKSSCGDFFRKGNLVLLQ